jgi:hypothetical protein
MDFMVSFPNIILTDKKITHLQLNESCSFWFGDMVKVTVDVEKKIVGIGGELHADAEQRLIEKGSRSEDIWGINFYPWLSSDNRIEYSALINIRPRQDNPSMELKNPDLRERIQQIVENLILGPDEKLV